MKLKSVELSLVSATFIVWLVYKLKRSFDASFISLVEPHMFFKERHTFWCSFTSCFMSDWLLVCLCVVKNQLAINDTTEALRLQPNNVKALFRRAQAKKVCSFVCAFVHSVFRLVRR